MSDGLKITTIGGGSSYTPELIEGFIKRYKNLPVKEIWLVDIEEGRKKLEIITNLAKRMVKEANLPIEIHSTLDRKKALYGADFVTTQIRVGLLEARILDERIPLSHKMIGQETNGAGGMFKALRTIPVILDIDDDMSKLCPNAFLINFTNPAGMVTEALLKYGKNKKILGLCNVPIGMEKAVAQMLNVNLDRIRINFAGLNHMVFGMNIYCDGEEVTNKVIELIADNKMDTIVKNFKDFSWSKDFIKSLGVMPCPYHKYYFQRKDMLKEELQNFDGQKTRAQEVKKIEESLFELYKDENLKEKPKELEKRGGAYYSDAACRLIDSIYNDKKDIQPVNTRNNGAILDLDENSAVEVSSIITKQGAIPLTMGKLPVKVNGLIQQIKSFEKMTIEAAVTGDYHKALMALSINPLVDSETTAKVVLDELLLAHKKYLPQFFK